MLPRAPLLIAVLLSVSITSAVSMLHGFLDLQVYRVGTLTWLHHGALYGPMPLVQGKELPFTYAPPAALLMTPLAEAPLWLAKLLVTVSSLACLAVTVWLVLSRLRPDLEPRARVALTTGATVALLFTEPIRLTLWFGQINIVLMAAVALDCLTVKPRWPRGLLIGIAAVTKLTPAAFLLYFVIRRDWKTAGTTVTTAAGAVLTGFLLLPRESRQYWFHTVADTGRIGLTDYVGNQSLKGMVFRLGLPHSVAMAVWFGLSLVVLCFGAALMHRLFVVERALDHAPDAPRRAALLSIAALLVNAAVLLLGSPVSWTHHWVWIAPALVAATVWTIARPNPARVTALAGFAAVFLIGPGLVPNGRHRELDWSWWQHIPGEAYIIVTVGLGGYGLVRLCLRRIRAVGTVAAGPLPAAGDARAWVTDSVPPA